MTLVAAFAPGLADDVGTAVDDLTRRRAEQHHRPGRTDAEHQCGPPAPGGDEDRRRGEHDEQHDQQPHGPLGEDEQPLGQLQVLLGVGQRLAPIDDQLTEVVRERPVDRRRQCGDLLLRVAAGLEVGQRDVAQQAGLLLHRAEADVDQRQQVERDDAVLDRHAVGQAVTLQQPQRQLVGPLDERLDHLVDPVAAEHVGERPFDGLLGPGGDRRGEALQLGGQGLGEPILHVGRGEHLGGDPVGQAGLHLRLVERVPDDRRQLVPVEHRGPGPHRHDGDGEDQHGEHTEDGRHDRARPVALGRRGRHVVRRLDRGLGDQRVDRRVRTVRPRCPLVSSPDQVDQDIRTPVPSCHRPIGVKRAPGRVREATTQ